MAGEVRSGDAVEIRRGATTVSERAEVHSPVSVYDLTVSPHHTFFANGVLLHNKSVSRIGDELNGDVRHALDIISRDASMAWASLPPEFPAIATREIDASVGDHDPDVLEIVRPRSEMDRDPGPHRVASFDGEKVVLQSSIPDLDSDELLLVYNNGLDGSRGWVLGRVTGVTDQVVRLATDSVPAEPPFPRNLLAAAHTRSTEEAR